MPVYTLAQTITWIWWSHLDEMPQEVAEALLWMPFYLWVSFLIRRIFL